MNIHWSCRIHKRGILSNKRLFVKRTYTVSSHNSMVRYRYDERQTYLFSLVSVYLRLYDRNDTGFWSILSRVREVVFLETHCILSTTNTAIRQASIQSTPPALGRLAIHSWPSYFLGYICMMEWTPSLCSWSARHFLSSEPDVLEPEGNQSKPQRNVGGETEY